jgi:hypothetical protein
MQRIFFQIIVSEGEFKASRALKEAADILAQSPCAMQLRYLQTLSGIAAEQNSTIVFPLPVDFASIFHRFVPTSHPISGTLPDKPTNNVFLNSSDI